MNQYANLSTALVGNLAVINGAVGAIFAQKRILSSASRIGNGYYNSNKNCHANAMLAFFFLIVTLSPCAKADISDVYITTSCDPAGGVAKIAIDRIGEGDARPEGSKLLSSVNDHGNPVGPATVCSLGKKREVALLGLVNLDHPRNDNLQVYIGTRQAPYRAFFSYFLDKHTIVIRRLREDYYVSLEECDSKGECQKKLYTDPSFDCRKARSVAEKMICEYQPVTALDVELDTAYLNAIRSSRKPEEIQGNQKEWLQKRDHTCGIAGDDPSWSANETPLEELTGGGPLDQEQCLEKYYRDRIREINKLAERNR